MKWIQFCRGNILVAQKGRLEDFQVSVDWRSK